MKNFFKARIAPLFRVIALVAVIGFSMAGCKNDDDGGIVTFTIKGLTPNTTYYVAPAFKSDDVLGFAGFRPKLGRANADGTVSVSYSSANLGSWWGQAGYVCYGTTEQDITNICSEKTYKMTNTTYTLSAPDDFNN